MGQRLDGENLIKLWNNKNPDGVYITNRQGLKGIDYRKTSHLLGLFAPSHMSYNLDADRKKQPSLEEMISAAIQLLKKGKNGYFLFVEGALIDFANHETKAQKAIDETVELHKAVQKAVDLTSRDDTLVVVTADHSHTLTISGYPARGNNIFGTTLMYESLRKYWSHIVYY